MPRTPKGNHLSSLLLIALLAWLVPGAGHYILKETKRALIIFVTIVLTFCTGLYLGSTGVIDPMGAKACYVAQIFSSPLVAILGSLTAKGTYSLFGWSREVGQIYTSTAGLLNLLCIINAVYLAYLRKTQTAGD